MLRQVPDPAAPASKLDRPSEEKTSEKLRHAFRRLTDADPAYWSYEAIKYNENPQAYFQYPAMMVPRMQGDVLEAIQSVYPNVSRTFDPFAGSGTVLVESLKRGIDSLATDINPMALLLCKVKAQPFRVADAEEAFKEVFRLAELDDRQEIEMHYEKRAKWFADTALAELSRFRRSILTIGDLEIRRLLWVAFAEAVRLSSNSRTSTYKLHIRDSEDITKRAVGVAERIRQSMNRVLRMYKENEAVLTASRQVEDGSFRASGKIVNHDMRRPLGSEKADAIISSPPYGDNHTTVTYGQHSFLPLHWIPFDDIDSTLDLALIANTHSIDSASVGGAKTGNAEKREKLRGRSDSLDTLLANPKLPPEARQRLVSFFYDLDICLQNALSVLRGGGPLALTLGNRCVCGIRIQTDTIVSELLTKSGCEFIDTLSRDIPTKRMAHRNKIAGTMLTETLLVMRGPD